MNTLDWIKTVAAVVALGGTVAAVVTYLEPYHMTHFKTVEVVKELAPSKADVYHLANVRTDDLIAHIMPQIIALEEKIDSGTSTPAQLRKLERLKAEVKLYESRYIPDGHLHGNNFLIIGDLYD